MYIARNRSIKACISLYTRDGKADQEVLLDSGATENLIHPQLVEKLQIPTKKLASERKLFNVDSSQNRLKSITHIILFMIQCDEHFANHQFLVADIGEDDLILGYPFFEAVNPKIDWPIGILMRQVTLFNHDEWAEKIPEWDTMDTNWAHVHICKTTVA